MGFQNWVDSFKPPVSEHTQGGATPPSPPTYEKKGGDVEKSSIGGGADSGREDFIHDNEREVNGVTINERGVRIVGDEVGLQRKLSSRHMQMIAFGGAIGTGLFIGSGGALQSGGPASLLIDFALMGILLACTVMALGELATCLPVAGSFAAYSTRFIDPAWGAAMGWNYWMQWFVVLPLELVAASIVINYWDPTNKITPGVWVLIFIIGITVINLFGVKGYGEFEVGSSMVKILAVLGFMVAGIVINCGGAPSGEYLGAETWKNGRAFQNGFKGWCSVFVTAAFAYAGTELIGLAAAESDNPRKEVPKATKQVFYRVIFFYLVSLFIVSLIVPADNDALSGGSYDARASPFVIAFEIGKIKVLPSIFNAVILVSVLSVGNSSVYGASRTLFALARGGQAPKLFGYIDREGRPLPAVALSLAMGFLAFLIYSTSQNDVFNWLLALSGLSSIFTWGSICLAHIRFRKAWKLQGKTLEELPWASPLGAWGSWVGLSLNAIVLVATFYKAGWPIGEGEMTSSDRAVNFFQSYIAVPIVLAMYAVARPLVKGAGWLKLDELDIHTGRRNAPSLEQLRAEREELAAQPMWKKVKHFLL